KLEGLRSSSPGAPGPGRQIADDEVVRSGSVNMPVLCAAEWLVFHRELLWIARERGYKACCAGHKFKELWRLAVGPEPEPAPPAAATRSWVQSRQITCANTMDRRRST